ncbi:MAG: 4-hydroxy-3-methylbut-2-enyl diphosphate reductase [Kiritimatiellae bacterium]|nr:4-hydroxy-3-methylbut-2-enyl diphosphate reductase [Kiritimatiellia bacterium]
MKISVINPHGFCAGVTGALRKALRLADSPGRSLYCLHELVHNEIVVADMKKRGFAFVESLDDVPEGATVLFSAHGVCPEVRARAAARRLNVVDATCPFVDRVHRAARGFAARGMPVVVIGKASHAEVKGILGEAPDAAVICSVEEARAVGMPGGPVGVVSQTTMNADEVREIVAALRERFEVETTADVCNATKERQDAVKAFDGDAILVLGSASSSNTRRLCEVARCRAFRAGTMDELRALDLSGVSHLGVTSGASTPESFLDAAVRRLEADYGSGAPSAGRDCDCR